MPPSPPPSSRQSRPDSPSGEIKVDAEDLGIIAWQGPWRIHPDGYVRNSKNEYLHRLVMGCSPGDGTIVDHRNHDRADNRRANLRVGTVRDNQENRRGATRASKSGIRGVSWSRANNGWIAQFTKGGIKTHVGTFATPEAAAAALRRARDGDP